MSETLRPIVLHTSWRGRSAALAAPVILLVLATVGVAGGGWHWFPLVLGLGGLVLGAIVAVDYPLWCVFGPEGIARRCGLRTERLAWDQVDSVIRPAYTGRFGRMRGPTTGLVAVVQRRRYLLTDRMESRAEHEALLRAVAAWNRGMPVEASLPPDDHPPTWLYKRRRGGSGPGLVDLT